MMRICLTVPAADNVIRLLPALNIPDADITEALARLDRAATAVESHAAEPYSFHAALPADLPLLAEWLATPALREWWGDPVEELALLTEDLANPLMDQRIVCDWTISPLAMCNPTLARSGAPRSFRIFRATPALSIHSSVCLPCWVRGMAAPCCGTMPTT